MTAITHALNAALLHSVWQGLAVMILFWLALWTLRRRSAATRYAVSCAALVILVALPVVTTCLLYEPPLVTAVRSETFRLAVAATPVAVKAARGSKSIFITRFHRGLSELSRDRSRPL